MSNQENFSPLDSAQEMLKTLWGGLNVPLPGLMAPTLDVDELEKRIADMRAVEGWLKMNLNMLQMTIQGLEMQKATLSAVRQAGSSGKSLDEIAGVFANPALWPWNLMQAATQSAADSEAGADAEASAKPDTTGKSGASSKKK